MEVTDISRLRLYASHVCPYTHRVLAALHVTGLAGMVRISFVEDVKDEGGWEFRPGEEPVFGARFMREVYAATDPGVEHRPSVPLLIDAEARRIVSSESLDIVRWITTGMGGKAPLSTTLFDPHSANDIDDLNAWIHDTINRGVYKVGFATDQATYEAQIQALFDGLDTLEIRLSDRAFLMGDSLREPDLILYPTLVRFDAIYHFLFRCSLRRIADYANLSAYLERLLQVPGLAASTNLERAREGYFKSVLHTPNGTMDPNPSKIVPAVASTFSC